MQNEQFGCYEYPWIIQELQRAVDKVSHRVTNTERIERRALTRIGSYLLTGEDTHLNRKHITRLIYQETASALKYSRKEQTVHFADISYEDDYGEIIEFDPVDVLANVESEFFTKETVALLAKNDGRRKMILNAWANGFTNDRALSETLAGFFGGQARGHCSYIQRFRIECRGVLSATAI